MAKILFAWPEFPDYAARSIKSVVERGHVVDVVATRPKVPVRGMERSLGQRVLWVEHNQKCISLQNIDATLPDVIFMGGYGIPVFNRLEKEVRRNKGSVILMSDHNWTGSLRQLVVDPVRHRMFYRSRFDGVFVPGDSGVSVARSWGYQSSQIFRGMYGADPELFRCGNEVIDRPKKFIFVGQLIPRKNVKRLAQAFLRLADERPDWSLTLCGTGVMEKELPNHPSIEKLGFVQPSDLSSLLRESRCLVLPSNEEHWGLVVHEAALSGCSLALSSNIGSAVDLIGEENGVTFNPRSTSDIYRSLLSITNWSVRRSESARLESLRLASTFGPRRFADSVEMCLRHLSKP
ncbi:MAG: glycosyltransferase family 4 protein [Halioglobus sp.]